MSRTIRRKNEKWLRYHYVDGWYRDCEHFHRGWQEDKPYAKRYHHFHGDHMKHFHGHPARFLAVFKRAYRSRCNQIVRECLKMEEPDVVLPHRYTEFDSWNW